MKHSFDHLLNKRYTIPVIPRRVLPPEPEVRAFNATDKELKRARKRSLYKKLELAYESE